jgi:hypothetical protein
MQRPIGGNKKQYLKKKKENRIGGSLWFEERHLLQ